MTETVGRRERKKAATRQALADAALRLFLEHGYDAVSVKDVAEAADVSTTTLFKHFSGKEALVFDEDESREAELVAAVRDRAPGTSVPRALHGYVLQARMMRQADDPQFAAFRRLIERTPALREHAQRMWTRHESALAHAIAEEVGAPREDVGCAALARFALDAPVIAVGRPDPRQAVDQVFALIEQGWDRTRTGAECR